MREHIEWRHGGAVPGQKTKRIFETKAGGGFRRAASVQHNSCGMKPGLLSPYGWGSLLRLVMVADAEGFSYGRRGRRRDPLL